MTGPPFPSLACRGGRLHPKVNSCTPDGDPFLCLVPASYLLCTDLATDLVRGSARPLLVLDCQAPLLLGCVPHRDVSPFSYDTGRGVRAASLASHGQPAVLTKSSRWAPPLAAHLAPCSTAALDPLLRC